MVSFTFLSGLSTTLSFTVGTWFPLPDFPSSPSEYGVCEHNQKEKNLQLSGQLL